MSPELNICTLGFPVVWQQGAGVCVIPPFCDGLVIFVVPAQEIRTAHNITRETPSFCPPVPAVPLVHPVKVPKVECSDSQAVGFEMSCCGFWLLVLSGSAWLWKWRSCSTLQKCRNYASNLQQCWETVFEIIKLMTLQQQSESNPCYDQSSDLGSLAGWNIAKQFWTAVVTNCLWVIILDKSLISC